MSADRGTHRVSVLPPGDTGGESTSTSVSMAVSDENSVPSLVIFLHLWN
jgi:hypothetical protein